MLRTLGWLLFVLGYVVGPVFAQVTGPPHVFVANTVASPDEVNLNFSTVYGAALNRAGGTMTGNLLFSADNTLDIGASGATRPRDLFLGRNAAIGGTLGVTGATTLSAALGGTSATFSGTVTGNLFSGSGASLTSIPETAITDGSLLARLAAAEVLTGQWRASNGLVVGTTGFPGSTGVATISLVSSAGFSPLNFYDAGGASDEKWTQLVQSAGQTIVRFVNDAGTLVFDPITIDRVGYNAATITLNSTLTLTDFLVLDSVTHSLLGGGGNGTVLYCTDCNRATTPCTSGGTGALAVQINSSFACF